MSVTELVEKTTYTVSKAKREVRSWESDSS